jgi:hypothetical protein
MSIHKLRSGRVPTASALTYVGEKGTIFWDEATGELKLSDGHTAGGSHLPIVLASPTVVGGVKLGPGVELNNDGQIIINSAGLSFNFGDFQATTPPNGAATLGSIQPNQDIAIVSSGTGVINMVGDFHIHRTADYNPNQIDLDGAVFAVKGDGQIQMKVPLADSQVAALEIIGNDSGFFIAPNQTGVILHVTGNSGLVSRNYFDANQNYALLVGRRYNGTQSAPTKVLAGEMFFRVAGQASGQAASEPASFQTFGPCQIDWVATENQGPNNQGGELRFRATPNGTNAQTGGIIVATINATTGLTATKFVGPLTGNVTGNADTVTNGVYTNGSYANPSWITSLAGSKVTNAVLTTDTGTVTNTMLAGSIANNKLVNTTIQVNGITLTLGDTAKTITAAAGTLTGTTLNSTVVTSSLTSVGTLGSLGVTGTVTAGLFDGINKRTVRNAGTIVDSGTVTIDFSTDDVVEFVWGNGVALAYQNYTAGRIVKVIARKATGTGTDSLTLDGITPANTSSGTASFAGNQDQTYFIELTCTGTTVGSVYAKF